MYLIYESNECSMIDIVLMHPEEGIISRLHCQFLFRVLKPKHNEMCYTCDVRLDICLHLNNKTFCFNNPESGIYGHTYTHIYITM